MTADNPQGEPAPLRVFATYKKEPGGGWSYTIGSLNKGYRTKGEFADTKAADRHFKRLCRKNGWLGVTL
jgi:hypothetical protein